MKICMILMNLGSVKHDVRVRKEASSLAKAGHRVRLVAMQHPGEDFGKTMDGFELRLFRLWTRRLPRNLIAWLLKYIEYNIKVFIRLTSFRAHVYHAHDLNTLIPAWLMARLMGAKVVYDAHELYTGRPVQTPWLWRRVEQYLITRVDTVIAANDDRAEVMLNEYGARELPSVIMNCPSSVLDSATGRVALREALPLEVRTKRIVLYQGGLSPNRCLEELTISAKYFNECAILVFVGNSSFFSESVLKGLVTEHRLAERVYFLSAVDSRQLVHFISSADIGVVIYKNSCRNNYLCAPNKLFDYCMAGLPSIGCDFPPIRRIAEKYGTTILFDPENPKSIAAAVNSLIENDTTLSSAKAATAIVASEFNWEHEERKLAEIYCRL
jgi:glycosyltransferase involved in cell wall biosynthesis